MQVLLTQGALLTVILGQAVPDVLYRATRLGSLGFGDVGATAISEFGHACGWGPASSSAYSAVYWDPATGLVEIGDLPGGRHYAEGLAINNRGHVAGLGYRELVIEAFFWTPETGMQGIGLLPGTDWTEGYGINDLDQVVGIARYGGAEWEAFLWDPVVGMIGLGELPGGQYASEARDINNLGQVTGFSISDVGWHAFIWDAEGGMRAIAPTGEGWPYSGRAINDLGQVVGSVTAVPGTVYPHSFLWDSEEGLTVIRVGQASGAFGVNDLGQVVGEYWRTTAPPDPSGFIWDRERGARDLGELVEARSRQRFGDLWFPHSINNAGQIAASGLVLTPFVLGDMNCDGVADVFDIDAFVTGLLRPGAYGAAYPGCFRKSAGDINQDGEFDAFDIEPFVRMLSEP